MPDEKINFFIVNGLFGRNEGARNEREQVEKKLLFYKQISSNQRSQMKKNLLVVNVIFGKNGRGARARRAKINFFFFISKF